MNAYVTLTNAGFASKNNLSYRLKDFNSKNIFIFT